MKDKNGNILKVGNWVADAKGEEWHIQNISGVTFLVQSDKDKILKTKVLSKVDLSEYAIIAK